MPINYSVSVKNARMNAVKNAIDAGVTAGKLNIYTSGYGTLLVSIVLSKPCGTVDNGVLTFTGVPRSGVAVSTGNASIARLVDANDVVVAEGLTVGTSGADIVIDNVNIASGQTVNLTSAVITHG